MEDTVLCPKCDGEAFEFNISNRDRILYRCKKCHYRFNSLSGTRLKGSRLSDEQILLLHELIYDKQWQIVQIASELQTTRKTVYRYKKLWDSERKEPPNEA